MWCDNYNILGPNLQHVHEFHRNIEKDPAFQRGLIRLIQFMVGTWMGWLTQTWTGMRPRSGNAHIPGWPQSPVVQETKCLNWNSTWPVAFIHSSAFRVSNTMPIRPLPTKDPSFLLQCLPLIGPLQFSPFFFPAHVLHVLQHPLIFHNFLLFHCFDQIILGSNI